MSAIYEAMSPGGHETYATSIFSKIKTYLDSNPYGYITSYTDTKNTAGSTDTSSKIFLIGATSQAANPRTYSHDTAYVGTDGCLYSGGTKVLTAHQDISGKADKSATVSNVAWSNNKLTKTINGTTSDVVSAATILGNLTSSQVTTALGYVPGPSYYFESSDNSIAFSSSMVPGRETVDMTVEGKVSTAGDTISGDYTNTADFSEGGVTGKRVTTYGPWGIDVEEYVGTSLWSRLSLRDSDILLTKTWDGTNTSLKQAIEYLGSQSAVNKVDYIHSTDASEYTIDTLANTDSLAVMGVTLSGTPTANHGAFLNVKNVGTPFQLFMPDNVRYIYKRYRNNSTGAYYDWFKLDAGYSDTSGRSSYSNYVGVQRVSKDSRYKPGINTLVVEEFQNNSANLPSSAWYHVYTSEGSDADYVVQLALGMTVDGAYYRKRTSGGWGNWIDLLRPSWGNISGKPTNVYGNGGSKNVTAGTVLNCGSITLTAGTYLIIYMAGFPAGQANWKTCGAVVATANNSSSPINQAGLCNYRYGYDNETRVHGSTMYAVSTNTTLYLNLWGRGSGALAGCFGEIRAIRLF